MLNAIWQFMKEDEGVAAGEYALMKLRSISRTPVSFRLMYSCVDGDDAMMEDGTAVDLSKGGMGIRGNQPVQVGMELALFLYLPDEEDPLSVLVSLLAARVAWTGKDQFGVEFKKLSLQEGTRLRSFLCDQLIQ